MLFALLKLSPCLVLVNYITWVHWPPPNSPSFYPLLKAVLFPALLPIVTVTKGMLLRNYSNQRIMQTCKSTKAVFTQGCVMLSVLSSWASLPSEKIPSVSSQPLVDNSEHRGLKSFVPALIHPAHEVQGRAGRTGRSDRFSFFFEREHVHLPTFSSHSLLCFLSPIPRGCDVFWEWSLQDFPYPTVEISPLAAGTCHIPFRASSNATCSRKPSLTTPGEN